MKKITLLLSLFLLMVSSFTLPSKAESSTFQQGDTFFVDETHLYYADDYGIIKVDLATKEDEYIYLQGIRSLYDGGKVIYFTVEHQQGIFQINKDGTGLSTVIGKKVADFIYYQDHIFYLNNEDGMIYKTNTSGITLKTIEFSDTYASTDRDILSISKDQLVAYKVAQGFDFYSLDDLTLTSTVKLNANIDEFMATNDYLIYNTIIEDSYISKNLYVYNLEAQEETLVSENGRAFLYVDNQLFYINGLISVIEGYSFTTQETKSYYEYSPTYFISGYNGYVRAGDEFLIFNKDSFDDFYSASDTLLSTHNQQRDAFDQAYENSRDQKYIQRKDKITITYENAKRINDYTRSITPRDFFYQVEMNETLENGDKKSTKAERRLVYKDMLLVDYDNNSDKNIIKTSRPISPLEDKDTLEKAMTDLIYGPYVLSFYSSFETTDYRLYQLNGPSASYLVGEILNTGNMKADSGQFDSYECYLYLDKKSNTITKIEGSISLDSTTNTAPLYQPINKVEFEIAYQYSTKPFVTPTKEIKDHLEYEQIKYKLVNTSRTDPKISSVARQFKKLFNKDRERQYYYGRLLYSDEESSQTYTEAKNYCRNNPNHYLARLHVLDYELEYRSSYTKSYYKELINHPTIARDLYVLFYEKHVEDEKLDEANEVLETWYDTYPLDPLALEYKMENLLDNQDYKAIISLCKPFNAHLERVHYKILAKAWTGLGNDEMATYYDELSQETENDYYNYDILKDYLP